MGKKKRIKFYKFEEVLRKEVKPNEECTEDVTHYPGDDVNRACSASVLCNEDKSSVEDVEIERHSTSSFSSKTEDRMTKKEHKWKSLLDRTESNLVEIDEENVSKASLAKTESNLFQNKEQGTSETILDRTKRRLNKFDSSGPTEHLSDQVNISVTNGEQVAPTGRKFARKKQEVWTKALSAKSTLKESEVCASEPLLDKIENQSIKSRERRTSKGLSGKTDVKLIEKGEEHASEPLSGKTENKAKGTGKPHASKALSGVSQSILIDKVAEIRKRDKSQEDTCVEKGHCSSQNGRENHAEGTESYVQHRTQGRRAYEQELPPRFRRRQATDSLSADCARSQSLSLKSRSSEDIRNPTCKPTRRASLPDTRNVLTDRHTFSDRIVKGIPKQKDFPVREKQKGDSERPERDGCSCKNSVGMKDKERGTNESEYGCPQSLVSSRSKSAHEDKDKAEERSCNGEKNNKEIEEQKDRKDNKRRRRSRKCPAIGKKEASDESLGVNQENSQDLHDRGRKCDGKTRNNLERVENTREKSVDKRNYPRRDRRRRREEKGKSENVKIKCGMTSEEEIGGGSSVEHKTLTNVKRVPGVIRILKSTEKLEDVAAIAKESKIRNEEVDKGDETKNDLGKAKERVGPKKRTDGKHKESPRNCDRNQPPKLAGAPPRSQSRRQVQYVTKILKSCGFMEGQKNKKESHIEKQKHVVLQEKCPISSEFEEKGAKLVENPGNHSDDGVGDGPSNHSDIDPSNHSDEGVAFDIDSNSNDDGGDSINRDHISESTSEDNDRRVPDSDVFVSESPVQQDCNHRTDYKEVRFIRTSSVDSGYRGSISELESPGETTLNLRPPPGFENIPNHNRISDKTNANEPVLMSSSEMQQVSGDVHRFIGAANLKETHHLNSHASRYQQTPLTRCDSGNHGHFASAYHVRNIELERTRCINYPPPVNPLNCSTRVPYSYTLNTSHDQNVPLSSLYAQQAPQNYKGSQYRRPYHTGPPPPDLEQLLIQRHRLNLMAAQSMRNVSQSQGRPSLHGQSTYNMPNNNVMQMQPGFVGAHGSQYTSSIAQPSEYVRQSPYPYDTQSPQLVTQQHLVNHSLQHPPHPLLRNYPVRPPHNVMGNIQDVVQPPLQLPSYRTQVRDYCPSVPCSTSTNTYALPQPALARDLASGKELVSHADIPLANSRSVEGAKRSACSPAPKKNTSILSSRCVDTKDNQSRLDDGGCRGVSADENKGGSNPQKWKTRQEEERRPMTYKDLRKFKKEITITIPEGPPQDNILFIDQSKSLKSPGKTCIPEIFRQPEERLVFRGVWALDDDDDVTNDDDKREVNKVDPRLIDNTCPEFMTMGVCPRGDYCHLRHPSCRYLTRPERPSKQDSGRVSESNDTSFVENSYAKAVAKPVEKDEAAISSPRDTFEDEFPALGVQATKEKGKATQSQGGQAQFRWDGRNLFRERENVFEEDSFKLRPGETDAEESDDAAIAAKLQVDADYDCAKELQAIEFGDLPPVEQDELEYEPYEYDVYEDSGIIEEVGSKDEIVKDVEQFIENSTFDSKPVPNVRGQYIYDYNDDPKKVKDTGNNAENDQIRHKDGAKVDGVGRNEDDEQKDDGDYDKLLCDICMDRPKNASLLCGHRYCYLCACQMRVDDGQCAFCKRPIITVIKTFN